MEAADSLMRNLAACGQDVVAASDVERRTIAHRLGRRAKSAARLIGLVNEQVKNMQALLAGRGETSFGLVLPRHASDANPDRSWQVSRNRHDPALDDVRTQMSDDRVHDEVIGVELFMELFQQRGYVVNICEVRP